VPAAAANDVAATCPVPWRPRRSAGPQEERHDAARVADVIAEVEVVGLGIVEVDGTLDEAQAEHPDVEVEVALRVAGDRGDVMDAEDFAHGR
jgi:hypothetical protein